MQKLPFLKMHNNFSVRTIDQEETETVDTYTDRYVNSGKTAE